MDSKYYLKLQELHKHIKKEDTGVPCSLGAKIGVSRRTFFYMVDDLRTLGASISYCRKRNTYYYNNDFDLRVEYRVTIICDGEENVLK